jgi:hypothetical protein
MYRGKPSKATYKVARTSLGSLAFELIQPASGDSIYQDWLSKHGEGFQCLMFATQNSDVASVQSAMERIGFPAVQSGHADPSSLGRFSIFDTRNALRCMWGTRTGLCDPPANAAAYPADPGLSAKPKVPIADVPQVALIVSNMQSTIRNYWNILGIGPWELRDWGSYVFPERLYRGKPAWARENLGHAFVGDLDLEIFEPVEGKSLYQEWLDEYGEGIHHVKIRVDDFDQATTALDEEGFVCLSRGRLGPESEKSGFAYYYIEPLHSIWEPIRESEAGRVGKPDFFPPELAYPIERTLHR